MDKKQILAGLLYHCNFGIETDKKIIIKLYSEDEFSLAEKPFINFEIDSKENYTNKELLLLMDKKNVRPPCIFEVLLWWLSFSQEERIQAQDILFLRKEEDKFVLQFSKICLNWCLSIKTAPKKWGNDSFTESLKNDDVAFAKRFLTVGK
jgi:hypothetical protein